MKTIFKLIKVVFVVIVLLVIIVGGVITYNGYILYKEKTNEISIEQKVENIRGQDDYISYDDIPKTFVNAIVSIEDRRFFTHNGIDIQSIGRAIITDISKMELVEGGSTITQQLAKNIYFTQEKKFTRKVAEILTAFDLEEKYSKEEILELYINILYFGDGYYGIYQASKGYFDKEPKDLNLYEITLLAGLPNAPSAYALNNETDLYKQRQNMVIDAMVENNCMTEEEANVLKNSNN